MSQLRIAATAAVLSAAALVGCDRSPTSPVPAWDAYGPDALAAAPESTTRASGDFTLVARSGRDPIVFVVDGQRVRGTFNARLVSRRGEDSGTIVAEWTPATSEGRRARTFQTEIVSMNLTGSDPAIGVSFLGRARLTDPATGRPGPWFAVRGTAEPAADAPDCVIFDILGGDIDLTADVPGRLKIKG